MHIDLVRRVDASEPDEDGQYDYYYEYDIYLFTEGATCFVARSYTDQPGEAHILRIETNGVPRVLTDKDLRHPLSLAAQSHLRSEGKMQLRWLSGRGDGYESVPMQE